ncbi:MAG: CBS domain-containing protein, partial [Hyphomicrobium sp.]
DYVRDFIANVNPLSVLTAWNVMRDKRDLEDADDNWIWLDRKKTTKFRIDDNGVVVGAECEGRKASWVSCSKVEGPIPENSYPIYWARPGTSLKTVILAMHKTAAAPVALFDDADRFVGAISVPDVLQAILRRSD